MFFQNDGAITSEADYVLHQTCEIIIEISSFLTMLLFSRLATAASCCTR
jgi:hypothetical protein